MMTAMAVDTDTLKSPILTGRWRSRSIRNEAPAFLQVQGQFLLAIGVFCGTMGRTIE